jgi:hypothetical protein
LYCQRKIKRAQGASDSVIKFAPEVPFENFRIGDDLLAGATTSSGISPSGRAFLLVLPPRHPVAGGPLRLRQRRGAFQAHAGSPER